MKTLSLLPKIRLELRDLGQEAWQVFDLAHSPEHAETKIARFKATAPEGVEIRSVENLSSVPGSAPLSEHPEFLSLSNLRDDVSAIFGTDDRSVLQSIKKSASEAAGIEYDLKEKISGLHEKIAQLTRVDAEPKSEIPFTLGQPVRDIHTGTVVRVSKIEPTGFTWVNGDEKGFCPLESIPCFEALSEGEEAKSEPVSASTQSAATEAVTIRTKPPAKRSAVKKSSSQKKPSARKNPHAAKKSVSKN